jgi:hypothetical protein
MRGVKPEAGAASVWRLTLRRICHSPTLSHNLRFEPSPARAALRYDFDGRMFDAGVEGGEFATFAGSSISQVEVG